MLPAAAAIELIHTYSLIHDDLPAMDDDDLRRGRPTSHVKHGEDVAILAGDGLFAEAINLFCSRAGGRARRTSSRRCASWRRRPGSAGMVGGQYMDVAGAEDVDAEGLRRLHSLKTGRLIGASVIVPLKLVGSAEAATIAYRSFADELGVLFQIVDDILDVTGSDAELGKPRGSDERHGKLTYVSLFGLERAHELAAASHANARATLERGRRRHRGPRADHRLHPHPPDMSPEQPEPRLIDAVDGPADLKGLDDAQLAQVAQEVREEIIDTIGEIGGHFGANLGTCELADRAARAAGVAARQDPLGRRPPGLPAQDPHRPARPARRRSASTRDWRRSARSPSPSTTSWAPATPRPRSATRSG